MQQAGQPVARGHLFHHLHHKLVVVRRDVACGEDRRELMLRRGDLVVLRLREDAELPQLVVQVPHERGHARLDDAEVMVLHLLALRRLRAEQGAARVDKVLPLFIHGLVDEKIFLLRPDGCDDAPGVRVAEQAQDAQRLLVDGVHGAQQRGFLVQRFAAVGAERRRDAEGVAFDERVARGVPGGVAPRLKRGAQAAGGEAGGVGLPLDQLFAGKLHQHLPARDGGDEAVVLLGGDAGHRLEPVGIMGGAFLQRPLLHRVRNDVRHLRLQRLAVLARLPQRPVGRLRQPLLHHRVVEYQAAEHFRNLAHHESSPCSSNLNTENKKEKDAARTIQRLTTSLL